MIDLRLTGIKYSNDFHRTSKSISEYNTYKASELRNILLYIGVLIFSDILKEEHFEHFLCLVIAIRILTQEKVGEEDLICSQA